MAEVVKDKQEVVASKWWDDYKILAIAAVVGLVWWGLWLVLREYVLDVPTTAGSVANVLVAVIATAILIRLKIARPLVVTLASAAVLWSLGGALSGLWWLESLAWAVGLFMLSYGLFSLIANIRTMWLSVVIALVVAATLVILVSQ